MPLSVRVLAGITVSLCFLVFPQATRAGGPAPGGVGGGGINGYTVQVDGASPAHHNYGFDAFYPRQTTVAVGQTVTWHFAPDINAFHTIAILPAGETAQQVWRELNFGGAYPDAEDGPHVLTIPTQNWQAPGCGNSAYYPATPACAFGGVSRLNSGLQFPAVNFQNGTLIRGVPLPSYSVQFNAAPGVYHYFCLVHGPSMSGTIRVTAAGTAIASPAAQWEEGQREFSQATQKTEAWENRFPAVSQTVNGHSVWHVHAGLTYRNVEVDEYVPSNLHVKSGDTVVWTGSNEPGGFHTVTFPAESRLSALTLACEAVPKDVPFRGRYCAGLEVGFDPRGAFPNGPPGRPYTGSGVVNSGIIFIPKPHPWSVSFPSAGTYRYDCLIHLGMDGAIRSG